MSDALFTSLFAALESDPANNDLRVQVASLLLDRGRSSDAIEQASIALRQDPTSTAALDVLTRSVAAARAEASGPESSAAASATTATPASAPRARDSGASGSPASTASSEDFDWSKAEAEVGSTPVPPPFVPSSPDTDSDTDTGRRPDAGTPADGLVVAGGDEADAVVDEYRDRVTLADVGGLVDVKRRLEESFLEPMRHPELAKAFGKTLRGGLILYGPPGCGKTFMARAIAGELGARFLTASIADVLGSHFGETEKNMQALFAKARSLTPAVLFLDEIDALGARRSSIGTGWSGMRAIVDQLLLELDSITSDNDGLFVLAATNSPWEVDPSLLRPGRFDRMLLVLPPDAPAREAILRMHLERRPIAGIDLGAIVRRTEDFSGADLEHLVASAAEQAMLRSIAAGEVSPIGMPDLEHVLTEVKPSTKAWFTGARNVADFANGDGRYDDLVAYLKSRRKL